MAETPASTSSWVGLKNSDDSSGEEPKSPKKSRGSSIKKLAVGAPAGMRTAESSALSALLDTASSSNSPGFSRILDDPQYAEEMYQRFGVATHKSASLLEDPTDSWSTSFTEPAASSASASTMKKKVTFPPLDEMDLPDRPLIDLLVHNEGFLLEFGSPKVALSSRTQNIIEDAHLDYQYYEKDMAPQEHRNWVATGPNGPLALSIGTQPVRQGLGPKKNLNSYRVLLRTKEGDERLTLLAPSFKDVLKTLRSVRPEHASVKWSRCKDPSIVTELISFEQQSIVTKYKFGVLFCKEGQVDEDEMFSNTEPSPAFAEFLEFLGEEVPLDGWPRFAGGLDTRKGATGTTSVYTQHEGFEIMFHVSTMLPFFPADKQQLERKRHLGNDVVVIVFLDGSSSCFSPLWLASHFNHVFFVIEKSSSSDSQTLYNMAIAHKHGVRYYSPYIPAPAVFPKGPDFRHWLLTKLINSERAAMCAPAFCEKLSRTRKMLLGDLYNRMVTPQ